RIGKAAKLRDELGTRIGANEVAVACGLRGGATRGRTTPGGTADGHWRARFERREGTRGAWRAHLDTAARGAQCSTMPQEERSRAGRPGCRRRATGGGATM